MKLLIPIFMNILLVVAVYLAERHTKFKTLPYMTRQLVIGVLFGAVSCVASSYGVELLGTVANVRDAAPPFCGIDFRSPCGYPFGCDRRRISMALGLLGCRNLHAPCLYAGNDSGRLDGGGASKIHV